MYKQFFYMFILALFASIMTNCASKYRTINPATQQYSRTAGKGSISLAWQPDVLKQSHNKKYAKKAAKKNVQMLAVQVKNNSGKTIVLGRDYRLMDGATEIQPLTTDASMKLLGQQPFVYAGYLALGAIPVSYQVGYSAGDNSGSSSGKSHIPSLVAGAALAGTNFWIANKANHKMFDELQLHNLVGKEIRNGDTFYGLVVIQGAATVSNLSVKAISK